MASTCGAISAVCCIPTSSHSAARCSAAEPCTSSVSINSSSSNVKFPRAEGLHSASSSRATERPAILDPALEHANLMWFKGSYNTQIFVNEDEPADSVVRRFRKAVMQAGVIPECRRRRFFETPQDIAKRKLQAAQRRNKSRRFTPRPDFAAEKKGGGAKANDDDDYWGYTEE